MGRSSTGLGMSVVWGTIQDHSGYINIESEPGAGTSIELFFPVTREPYKDRTAPLDVKEYLANGEEILLVDDDNSQRAIAGAILTKLGYKIIAVSSGEEAITYLQANSVDLVVLDIIMEPGIDRLETYKDIIRIHPDQKTIIASEFSETKRIKEAQGLGAGEYVKKPYTMERSGLAVRNELAGDVS